MALLFPAGQQFLDSNGDPIGAGKLYVYDNGTSNEASVYSDPSLTVSLSNSIVLDSAGRLTTNVYVANGTSYTVALYTSGNALVWSRDDIWGYTDGTDGSRVNVDDYAVGDGVTDDTASIQAAAAAVQAAGGGILSFGAGKTYRIYPTGTLAGSILTFCSFSGLSGVTVDLNGATLAVEDSLTTNEQIVMFTFSNCDNVKVCGGTVTSDTTVAVASDNYGLNVVDLTNSTKNVRVENMVLVGAMTGVRCYRTVASEAESTKVRGVVVENLHCTDVAQPLNFQNSGDDVFARNVYCNKVHRAYFPYGIRNHDISVNVRNADSHYVNISAYSTDTTTNYCENIRVNLTVEGYDTTTAIGSCTVRAVYDSAANGCTLRNIHVRSNIKFNDSSSSSQRMFEIGKYVNAGSTDTTASRGHVFENITFGGNMYGVDIASHEVCELFRNGDFTDETCRGIGFRDLVVTGSVNNVVDVGDLSSMEGELFFDNCYFSGTSTVNPSNWGSYGVRLRNTYILGQWFSNASYPRTYTTGTFSMSAFHGIIYLDSSGGAITATLPNGNQIGQECLIIMTDASNSSTVSVSNHETSDPEVFTFAQTTDTLLLRWMGSQWITVANSGVVV